MSILGNTIRKERWIKIVLSEDQDSGADGLLDVSGVTFKTLHFFPHLADSRIGMFELKPPYIRL